MVISFADAIVVIPLPLFPLLQLRLKLKTNNYLRDEVQLDPISPDFTDISESLYHII